MTILDIAVSQTIGRDVFGRQRLLITLSLLQQAKGAEEKSTNICNGISGRKTHPAAILRSEDREVGSCEVALGFRTQDLMQNLGWENERE